MKKFLSILKNYFISGGFDSLFDNDDVIQVIGKSVRGAAKSSSFSGLATKMGGGGG